MEFLALVACIQQENMKLPRPLIFTPLNNGLTTLLGMHGEPINIQLS